MKAIVLTTKSGDWQGVYIAGVLIEEDHDLNDPQQWIEWTNRYSLTGVEFKEMNGEDSDYVTDYGTMHNNIEEYSGDY